MASRALPSELDLNLNLSSTSPENSFSVAHETEELQRVEIKTIFQQALEAGLDCPFAFCERYTCDDAPDPNLKIEGLGGLELPLSELDASALIFACVPERTDSAGLVANLGVWLLASAKVSFGNPAWQRWVQEVAGPTALRALCADCGDAQPDFVFQKLLVHERAFQTMELEVEPDSKVGSLVILLPSEFTEGKLELRHDGQSKQMELAEQSGLLTSVVAAYAGVEQTLSPMSSGYRLSLVYDIVHRGSQPPSLADLESPKKTLRNIMRAWAQDSSARNTRAMGGAPPFLACLLQNKYAHAVAFDASGDDKRLLSVLRSLAQELQFSLHLAHIEVTVKMQGHVENDDSVAWGAEDSMADDSFVSSFTDDGDVESLVVINIFDVEGIPVHIDGLTLRTTDLIIGPNATLSEPDSESWDEAGPSGTLSKTFKRTVLLLWPESSRTLNVRVGDV
ncbi:hypothetical protein B0H17DRAFT_1139760 [Mycena rosella]|uniref:Uncharacterized protein n=1 Tax=Mycena rosella TaxID=1033263 RepID=A0AAD7D3Y3_MYCRO|nr:hypothetical protein B0H17DRAFT_1139760 [Mycena rosella]